MMIFLYRVMLLIAVCVLPGDGESKESPAGRATKSVEFVEFNFPAGHGTESLKIEKNGRFTELSIGTGKNQNKWTVHKNELAFIYDMLVKTSGSDMKCPKNSFLATGKTKNGMSKAWKICFNSRKGLQISSAIRSILLAK